MTKKSEKANEPLYINRANLQLLIDNKKINVVPEGYQLADGERALTVADEFPEGAKGACSY